jgi:hypothetical protein
MLSFFAPYNKHRVLDMCLLLCAAILLCVGGGCGQQQPSGPAFDVPSLMNKQVAEIESNLAPQVKQQRRQAATAGAKCGNDRATF